MEHLSRVPKDRIAVLIGKSGKTKKKMERAARGKGKVSYVEDSSDSDDDLLDSDMEDAAERTTSRLRLMKSNSTTVCDDSDDSSLILMQ